MAAQYSSRSLKSQKPPRVTLAIKRTKQINRKYGLCSEQWNGINLSFFLSAVQGTAAVAAIAYRKNKQSVRTVRRIASDVHVGSRGWVCGSVSASDGHSVSSLCKRKIVP